MKELTAFRKYLVEGKTAQPNDDLKTPIKESKEEEQASVYWGIMVKNQPEDVIRMLTDLVTGKNTFDEFIDNFEVDMFDSFKDENFEDEDELNEDSEEGEYQASLDRLRTFDRNEFIDDADLTEGKDWADYDWDFSDSDSIDFGKFEVDIAEFKRNTKGFVVDNNGKERKIDKATIKDILQSYRENN